MPHKNYNDSNKLIPKRTMCQLNKKIDNNYIKFILLL